MRLAKSWCLVWIPLLGGCDAESRACREQMAQAQSMVNAVDAKSIESVKTSLSLVERARESCEKARLGAEREQLLKAKNELSGQLMLLEQRASRKKLLPRTPEELAQLVKRGDPACPKGQAYQQRETKQEVRCIGPQLVDMGREELKTYYDDRRFKVTTLDAPPTLKAELGSELYVFTFQKAEDRAAGCVTAFAAPGMSWQEVTSRLTGIPPEKLQLDTKVRGAYGELALKVEHETDKPTVRLGSCTTP